MGMAESGGKEKSRKKNFVVTKQSRTFAADYSATGSNEVSTKGLEDHPPELTL
jgi:hypothetical protein